MSPVDTHIVKNPFLWPMSSRLLMSVFVGVVATAAAVGTAGRAGASTTVPGAPGCPMFPADNVWNTNIANLPVNAASSTWMASMDSGSTFLHPDFGPSDDPSNPYGIPYTVVSPGHPFVTLTFQYASESDAGPYPFGPDTPIEGGAGAGGDRHAIMVDPSTCTLYELYDAQYNSSGSTAGSGAIWHLQSDALRPDTWTSADAAGLPILPGLVNYDEAASGSMDHAIRFTADCTQNTYLWPARHEAGQANPACPPMGARFRLKATFSLPAAVCSPMCQTVVSTMKNYGLILADNGSNWYFQGTADTRWTYTDVDQLKQIPASAFEAVDESSLMVNPGSGQAVQPRIAPPPAPAPTVPPTSTTVTSHPAALPTTSSPPPTSTTSTSVPRVVRLGERDRAGGSSSMSADPSRSGDQIALRAATRVAGGVGNGLDPQTWFVLSLGTLAVSIGMCWALATVRLRRRRRLAPTAGADGDV